MDDLPLYLKIHLVLAGVAIGIIALILIGFMFQLIGYHMGGIAGLLSAYVVFVIFLYNRYEVEKGKNKKN